MQIKTFTKHPEIVANHKMMNKYVKHLTVNLSSSTMSCEEEEKTICTRVRGQAIKRCTKGLEKRQKKEGRKADDLFAHVLNGIS